MAGGILGVEVQKSTFSWLKLEILWDITTAQWRVFNYYCGRLSLQLPLSIHTGHYCAPEIIWMDQTLILMHFSLLSCTGFFILIAASIYTARFPHLFTGREDHEGYSFILAWICFCFSLIVGVLYLVLRKKWGPRGVQVGGRIRKIRGFVGGMWSHFAMRTVCQKKWFHCSAAMPSHWMESIQMRKRRCCRLLSVTDLPIRMKMLENPSQQPESVSFLT